MRPSSELFGVTPNDFLEGADDGVVEPAVDRIDCILAIRCVRFGHFDVRQLGGVVFQGVSADREAGADDAALEHAVVIDQIDGHGGPEIGDDDGVFDDGVSRCGRNNPVGADLVRFIHPDAHR